jgi:hypothetical protein
MYTGLAHPDVNLNGSPELNLTASTSINIFAVMVDITSLSGKLVGNMLNPNYKKFMCILFNGLTCVTIIVYFKQI